MGFLVMEDREEGEGGGQGFQMSCTKSERGESFAIICSNLVTGLRSQAMHQQPAFHQPLSQILVNVTLLSSQLYDTAIPAHSLLSHLHAVTKAEGQFSCRSPRRPFEQQEDRQ